MSRSPELMAQMLQRSKRRSVPQIFIGEQLSVASMIWPR